MSEPSVGALSVGARLACAMFVSALCLGACGTGEHAASTADPRGEQAFAAFSARLDERLIASAAHAAVERPPSRGEHVQILLGRTDRAPGASTEMLERAVCLRVDSEVPSYIQLRDVRSQQILVRAPVPSGADIRVVVYVTQLDEASAVVAIRARDDAGVTVRHVAVLPCGPSKDADGPVPASTFGGTLVRAMGCPDLRALAWFTWNGAGSAVLAERKGDLWSAGMSAADEPSATDAERALLTTSFARWPAPVWCLEWDVPDC